MELSLLMRFRIAVSAAVGILLIGILTWPMISPVGPITAITVPTVSSTFIIIALAFLAGLIAYFLCWPHGEHIAILAVPFGLALCAVRSGTMADILRNQPLLAQRQTLFAAAKIQPLYWLIVVLAGLAGVWIGKMLFASKVNSLVNQILTQAKAEGKKINYLNIAIAVIISIILAQFCIRIFARDINLPDKMLGAVTAQPAVAQIAFGVIVAFAIVGFISKEFLSVNYIWPLITTGLVSGIGITLHMKPDIMAYLAQNYSATFSSHQVTLIQPIQMVAFGSIGSILGYWIAIRYNYWRHHELK